MPTHLEFESDVWIHCLCCSIWPHHVHAILHSIVVGWHLPLTIREKLLLFVVERERERDFMPFLYFAHLVPYRLFWLLSLRSCWDDRESLIRSHSTRADVDFVNRAHGKGGNWKVSPKACAVTLRLLLYDLLQAFFHGLASTLPCSNKASWLKLWTKSQKAL